MIRRDPPARGSEGVRGTQAPPLRSRRRPVILKQYYLGCLAHASYLVADEGSLTAAVVDPQRDVDQYLEDAEAVGLTIRHVLLTHFHADFVSGHLELEQATGASIHVGAAGTTDYPSVPARDGDALSLGDVSVRVLETPGHTPESVCYLVYDLAHDRVHPYAVLTGDTLFIGDVGRPDLTASAGASAEHLAGLLHDSIHRKLLALPDGTLVYPAHGAGSLCGKNLSTETVSTIGEQRRTNLALRSMSRAEFVRLVASDQPDAPAYFGYDADLNRRVRARLAETLPRALKPLSLDDVLSLGDRGATILDTRSPDAFAAAHLAGSVNVGLGGHYASWAGTLLSREKPIVLVADPGRETESATRLGRIGFDHVGGFLSGGPAAFSARSDLLGSTRREPHDSLARLLKAAVPPAVVDVRREAEFHAGHVVGSENLPLSRYDALLARVRTLAANGEVVVYCRTGYRSSIAASLLQRDGLPASRLVDLAGGWAALQGSDPAECAIG